MKKIIFILLIIIILVGCTSTVTTFNGFFVVNGTEEYYYLQYMDYNKKQLIEFYDLQRVIQGNFCNETYGNYITDITPQSFRLQCCTNFSKCENYVVINKQMKEIKIQGE